MIETEAFDMSVLWHGPLDMAASMFLIRFERQAKDRVPWETPIALDPMPLFRQVFGNQQGEKAGLGF